MVGGGGERGGGEERCREENCRIWPKKNQAGYPSEQITWMWTVEKKSSQPALEATSGK